MLPLRKLQELRQIYCAALLVSADLGCPDAHANQPLVHSYFSDYLELSYGSHHNHWNWRNIFWGWDIDFVRKEQKHRQRQRIGIEIAKVFKGLTKENCVALLLMFDKNDGSLEVLCSEMNDPKQVQDLALAALTEMRAPQNLPDVEGHPKVWTQ